MGDVYLSSEKILNTTVPAAWKNTLAALVEFIQVEKLVCKGGAQAQVTDRMRELHNILLTASARLVEPEGIKDLPDESVERIFAKSLLFIAHLKQSVVGKESVIDTAGSRTLELYESDFYLDEKKFQSVKERLAEILKLPATVIDNIEADVLRLSGDQELKIRMMTAVRGHFGFITGKKDLREPIDRLCAALFPKFPILLGRSELILTNTHIFICVRKTETEDPKIKAEADTLETLMRRQTPKQLANFPAFGFLNLTEIDPTLIAFLSKLSGLTEAQVTEELAHLVTVLKFEQVDQYIIHDTWGHGWQASLLQFEDMYKKLSEFSEPFSPPFEFNNMKAAGQKGFFAFEIARRLPAAMTGVLGEMLADVAEFKVIDTYSGKSQLMPNSSFFKFLPAKLDLTLQDAEYFFNLILKNIDDWAKAQVPGDGGALVWTEMRQKEFAVTAGFEEVDGDLKINLYTRLVLNFLSVHQALVTAYTELHDKSPGAVLPLKSFRDLLLVGTAVFFEEDRKRNMWKIDEFLFLKFIPLCLRLAR